MLNYRSKSILSVSRFSTLLPHIPIAVSGLSATFQFTYISNNFTNYYQTQVRSHQSSRGGKSKKGGSCTSPNEKRCSPSKGCKSKTTSRSTLFRTGQVAKNTKKKDVLEVSDFDLQEIMDVLRGSESESAKAAVLSVHNSGVHADLLYRDKPHVKRKKRNYKSNMRYELKPTKAFLKAMRDLEKMTDEEISSRVLPVDYATDKNDAFYGSSTFNTTDNMNVPMPHVRNEEEMYKPNIYNGTTRRLSVEDTLDATIKENHRKSPSFNTMSHRYIPSRVKGSAVNAESLRMNQTELCAASKIMIKLSLSYFRDTLYRGIKPQTTNMPDYDDSSVFNEWLETNIGTHELPPLDWVFSDIIADERRGLSSSNPAEGSTEKIRESPSLGGNSNISNDNTTASSANLVTTRVLYHLVMLSKITAKYKTQSVHPGVSVAALFSSKVLDFTNTKKNIPRSLITESIDYHAYQAALGIRTLYFVRLHNLFPQSETLLKSDRQAVLDHRPLTFDEMSAILVEPQSFCNKRSFKIEIGKIVIPPSKILTRQYMLMQISIAKEVHDLNEIIKKVNSEIREVNNMKVKNHSSESVLAAKHCALRNSVKVLANQVADIKRRKRIADNMFKNELSKDVKPTIIGEDEVLPRFLHPVTVGRVKITYSSDDEYDNIKGENKPKSFIFFYAPMTFAPSLPLEELEEAFFSYFKDEISGKEKNDTNMNDEQSSESDLESMDFSLEYSDEAYEANWEEEDDEELSDYSSNVVLPVIAESPKDISKDIMLRNPGIYQSMPIYTFYFSTQPCPPNCESTTGTQESTISIPFPSSLSHLVNVVKRINARQMSVKNEIPSTKINSCWVNVVKEAVGCARGIIREDREYSVNNKKSTKVKKQCRSCGGSFYNRLMGMRRNSVDAIIKSMDSAIHSSSRDRCKSTGKRPSDYTAQHNVFTTYVVHGAANESSKDQDSVFTVSSLVSTPPYPFEVL